MINFIGIGAQKSATSWVYACLYEHPEVCIPIKELHFFSRPRFSKGIDWYEDHFKNCSTDTKKGEFSTSYLYSEEASERIAEQYSTVKIIAILRHPVERAYSQYGNAIKAGEITTATSFDEYTVREESCFEQGKYYEQLQRYTSLFSKEQLLVLIQEDIEKDNLAFIQRIYTHIGVDASFVPPALNKRINTARMPKAVGIDTTMHRFAEGLRRSGFDAFVHLIRRTGIPDMVRTMNTKREDPEVTGRKGVRPYVHLFKDDVQKLSTLLGRDMNKEWNI